MKTKKIKTVLSIFAFVLAIGISFAFSHAESNIIEDWETDIGWYQDTDENNCALVLGINCDTTFNFNGPCYVTILSNSHRVYFKNSLGKCNITLYKIL